MHTHLGYTIWEGGHREAPFHGPLAFVCISIWALPFVSFDIKEAPIICIVFWKRVWGGSWVRCGTSFLITLKVKGILKGKVRSQLAFFFFLSSVNILKDQEGEKKTKRDVTFSTIADPWTTQGFRMLTLPTVENPHITYNPHISQPST